MRFTTRPELTGSFGMVASTHWLASAAGMATLEEGGNAFDAAVAAGLTLQVVEPHLNGPGGDAPILLWSAERGEPLVICGQGPAPEAATIQRFGELGLDLVPGSGLLPACVPGAFDAWMLLLRDFGTLRPSDVFRFAIHYAERGFPMLPRIVETIEGVEQLLRDEWPTSAELWLDNGHAPRAGTMWTNKALGATYRRILDEAESAGGDRVAQVDAARDAFLRGFVAEGIADYLERAEVMDSSGRRHGALLSAEDMAGFSATIEPPVTADYRGLTICKAGPWSQGPVFPSAAEAARGPRPRSDGARQRRLRAYGRGELEARVRGPGGLVRRSEVRRRAPGRPAQPRVRRGAPRARRRRGVVRAAPGVGPEGASRGCPRCRWPRRWRPGSASASPPSRPASGATPATWTSPTATATWSRPPPAAAGCTARRRFPGWACASAPGARCSGSPRGCPTRWSRASGRARRSPPRWRCATARRTWPSAPPAGTDRTSGRSSSCSRTWTSA